MRIIWSGAEIKDKNKTIGYSSVFSVCCCDMWCKVTIVSCCVFTKLYFTIPETQQVGLLASERLLSPPFGSHCAPAVVALIPAL